MTIWIKKETEDTFCESCSALIAEGEVVFRIRHDSAKKANSHYCCVNCIANEECFDKEDLSGIEFQEVKRHG